MKIDRNNGKENGKLLQETTKRLRKTYLVDESTKPLILYEAI